MARWIPWLAIALVGSALGARADDPPADATADEEPQVILYMTSWCHYCRLAADFLGGKGVAYSERNIETDTKALGEYMAAGGNGGVPLVVIGDTKIMGYDVGGMERALAALDAKTDEPSGEEPPPPSEPTPPKKPAGKWPKAVQGAAIDIEGDVHEPEVHYIITREDVSDVATLELEHDAIDAALGTTQDDEAE